MSSFTLADLAALPVPEVIETLDAETILDARKAQLIALTAARGIDYDASTLEIDPAVALLEEASFEEVVLRARGNDIARQRYLYFATGAALDHLAAFYDVTRLIGETDARLRDRVILAVQGRSTGGTAARYKGVALGASVRVAEAAVYRVGVDPTVNVAILSTDNGGLADAPLLTAVRNALGSDSVRMVNDTIVVRAAVVTTVNVTASLILQPATAETITTTLATALPAAWLAETVIGRDLTSDWVRAYLMAPGVHSIASLTLAPDGAVEPFSAVRVGTVTITVAGRNF